MKQKRQAIGFHRADRQSLDHGPANDLLGLAQKKNLQCNSMVGQVKWWSKKKCMGLAIGSDRSAMILLDQCPTRGGLY
jgi:hypothetical protein